MEQENRELEEITIKDIARMCGVGVSTVSRAINNHPDINPETKQKVMDIIQKYGYIPNNCACEGINKPVFCRSDQGHGG